MLIIRLSQNYLKKGNISKYLIGYLDEFIRPVGMMIIKNEWIREDF